MRFTFSCYTGTQVRGTIAYEVVNTTPYQVNHLYDRAGTGTGFGNDNYLPHLGSPGFFALRAPIVGMAPTADDGGYWMAAADGSVFAFGDGTFFGSMGSQPIPRATAGRVAG